MKYLALMVTVMMVACTGCIKNDMGCTNVSPQNEETQIQTYITANGITATKHPSGIYYQIINPGTGAAPTATSNVYITYTGKLLNGSTFDQQADASKTGWTLRDLIEGWQIGLPLIKKG